MGIGKPAPFPPTPFPQVWGKAEQSLLLPSPILGGRAGVRGEQKETACTEIF